MIMIAASCTIEEYNGQQFDAGDGLIPIGVVSNFNKSETKTSMSPIDGQYKIDWASGDKIGLSIKDRQSNILLTYEDGTAEKFSGYMKGGYPTSTNSDIEYVAYYPYRNSAKSGKINALLNRIQTAPFDSTLDYMVSKKYFATYDETDMPSILMDFGNHLFSIVKITVSNDIEELKDEKLTAVMLSSDNAILSGYFSFDPFEDDCKAVFSTEKSDTYNNVVSVYPEDKQPTLGVGKEHTVYFIVNCTEIPDLKVTISTTDGHARVFSAKSSVTLERNAVLDPGIFSLSSASEVIDHKIMALWGDSITAALTYRYSIQRELEPFWTVIKCGVNGDNSLGIAGRQGGVQFVTGEDFTIKDGTTPVDFGGFYTNENLFGETKDENYMPMSYNATFIAWYTHALRAPWINPVRIELEDGGYIDCETNYSGGGVYKLVPIEGYSGTYPVNVTKGSKIITYGSRVLANADMTVIYSGTNGGYRGVYDASGHYTGYDQLVSQQKRMVEHLQNKSAYIVLGYHFNTNITGLRNDYGVPYDIPYWSEDYRTTMSNAFGRHFIDLKTEGNTAGERLLMETGVVKCVEDIVPMDKDYIVNGEFPASFTNNPRYDVHPNEFGNRAIAILIKGRMKELGLL